MSRQEVMFIPLSIDSSGVAKNGYFSGDAKMIKAILGIFPYLLFLYMLLQMNAGLFAIFLLTVFYAFIYSYFLRFVIFEEVRLKKMLEELDRNSYSGLEHFWGVNKVSTTKEYSGLIQYDNPYKGDLTRAYVISYDRGSTIGVPNGNYEMYRHAKEEFMKMLYNKKYDFMWYEIPSRVKMPKSLEYYFNIMTKMENNAQKKLLKLQVEINQLFTMESATSYVDYIVVKSKNVSEFANFRESLEDIISRSLTNSSYILNPKILNKYEIDEFLEDLLLIKAVDSNGVLKGHKDKPLEEFGTVIRLITREGEQFVFNDQSDVDDYDLNKGNERDSVEYALIMEDKELKRKIKLKEAQRKKELHKNDVEYKYERITEPQYHENVKEINEKYDYEIRDIREGLDVLREEKAEKDLLEARKAKKIKKKQELEAKKEVKDSYVELDTDVKLTTTSEVINKLHSVEAEKEASIEDEISFDDLNDTLDDLLSLDEEVFEIRPNQNETTDVITTLDSNLKEFEKVDKSKFEFDDSLVFEDDDLLDFEDDSEVFEIKFDFHKNEDENKK